MARVEKKLLGGRYRLKELLGEGAMGSVYLAWDEKEKRKVAIKLLKTETWGNEARARLREEALSLRKLSHQGITRLLDFIEDEQRSFLVLEFVDGGNLNQYVAKNHPLPISRVVEMAVELCDALACAHKAGIIHRDLKPDNVLLSASGNLRLTDFGLALRGDRTAQLTATGTIQGTPSFISPEQIKGNKATAQSDIYSLGCLLYFLVTGEQPFKRENITEILQAHLNDQRASARKKRPDCPQTLAKIISKAMAVKSDERYKDCQQLKRALLNVGNEKASGLATFKSNSQQPFVNGVKQSNSKSPWPWLLLALLIGLAISFFFVGGETGTTKEPMLRLWPTTVEIDWTLASQSTCQCRLMDGTKTLRTQRVNQSLSMHSFSFRGLTPGQNYKVVLESSGLRKSINFVTPIPQLTSDVLSHAVNGHLYLDFSSNVKSGLTVQYGWLGEEQNSLVINDCQNVRRAFHFNEKSFHANDVVFVSWEVQLNGHTLAKGKVQAKQFFTTRWTPLKSTRRRGTLKMPTNVVRTFFYTPQDNREQMTAITLSGSGLQRLWAAKLFGRTPEGGVLTHDHLRKPVVTKKGKLITLTFVTSPQKYYSRATLFLLDHNERTKRWHRLFGKKFKVERPAQLDDENHECNQLIKGKEYFHFFQSDDMTLPGEASYLLDEETLIFNAIAKDMAALFVSFSLRDSKVNWVKRCSLETLRNAPLVKPERARVLRMKKKGIRSWVRQDSKLLRFKDRIYTTITLFDAHTGIHTQVLTSCAITSEKGEARAHMRYLSSDCDNWNLLCAKNGIFAIAMGSALTYWSPDMEAEGKLKQPIELFDLLAKAWGDESKKGHLLVSSPQMINGELLLVHKEIGQNPLQNGLIRTGRVKHNLSGFKIKDGKLVACKYLHDVHSECIPDDRDVRIYTHKDRCLLQLRDLLCIYKPGQRACGYYSFPIRITSYPRFVHSLVNDDGYLFASSRVGQLGVMPLTLIDALKKPIGRPKEVVIEHKTLKEFCQLLSMSSK